MRKNIGGRSRRLRRVCAFALILMLSLQLLPGLSLAAGEDAGSWQTLDNSSKQASSGKAVENTYIFEVSCGTRRGGDSADNVLYFIISYKSADGQKRTLVLAPHEDAVSKGYKMAEEQGNRNDRRDKVTEVFGCTVPDLETKKALGSLATDQYMFTTPEAILSIDQIQIFGKHNEEHGDWSCQGMRIYQVDTLYGLEMVGWYSDQGYIDFDGKVICQVEMPSGGVTFKWTGKSGMYTLTNSTAKGKVVNCDGPQHTSQLGTRVVFRIDFADTAGAGFESMAGSYAAGSRTKISDLKYCEAAALIVRYTDTFGCVRELSFPMMINALGQIMEVLGDAEIAEFAQQGDSLAVPLMLPDFASLDSVNVVIGAETAAEKTGLLSWAGSSGSSIWMSRVTQSKTDDVSYLCFAVYREVTAQVCLEGATLRTRFISGSPIQVSTATSTDGITVQADTLTRITLRQYESGMALTPKDRTERYLVTMSTDNVPNAGTAGDIYLQFTYISIQGKELQSSEYRVRDYVREFYGEWPGNTEDFAYNYGLRDGGTVQFLIPLQNVDKFENVSVRLSGEDEWQFTGIELAFVKPGDSKSGERSISPRLADWEDIAVTGLNNHPQGLFSHLRYTRQVETEDPCFTVGTVYEEGEERPDPNEWGSDDPDGTNPGGTDPDGTDPSDPKDKWTPGTLVQDDGETYIFDGETQEVTKKDDVPWDELRQYMTFNDAMQDLGFTKERCVYTVSVQVAGKTVNAGNDDCGSKNLFYFRLVFENGNSGCVLANQQIVGDAFGTGDLVQFKIRTSQDYGEVVAVQVIPDSQDSNSDIYDKLQIEEISVTRDSVSAVSPTWTAKIASGEDEGWVGIDYRDPGQMGGTSIVEGRTLSELATTFPITETSYSTNLLVSITTASYETGVQFTGGMRMDLNFDNNEGRTDPKPIAGFDVVEAMNAYGGLTGSKERKYKIGGETVTENAAYYVSDPRYQFLPGSTDSFIVTIKNVYQLTDMTLTVYSDAVTHWTIKDVSIYQLNGQGIRYLNPAGSYAYRYLAGQEPTLIARWDQDRLTTPLPVYDATQNSSMQPISFALDSETIKLSEDAAKWSSKILREPKSHDDTMNLILYPTVGSGAANPSEYDVTAAVKYTDLTTTRSMQISTGQMRKGTDDEGRTIFYAIGLTANNMNSFDGVDWSATILRTALPQIASGVLQVIRGGVLIDSYPLVGTGYSLRPAAGTTAASTQRLLLQVSEDTQKQKLKPEENDLAVALYYRTDDPTHSEYRTKYIFLSDIYEKIHPGQLLEMEFNIGNIGEVTGVNLVTMGKLDIKLDSAIVAEVSGDGVIGVTKSIRSPMSPDVSPVRATFDGDTALLKLALETAADEAGALSGTKEPIRLNVGYYDIYGSARTITKDNIRLYTESDNAFSSGGIDVVTMLIPDFSSLRWIELEPWHELTASDQTEGPKASWKLRSVAAAVGLDGAEVSRVVDQRIFEGTPLRIGLSDIMLTGVVTYHPTAEDQADGTEAPELKPETTVELSLSTGDQKSLTIDSGSDVKLTVKLTGSDEGYDVKLQSVNQETGELERAYIDETHGYTTEELQALLKLAEASAGSALSEAEKTVAQALADTVRELMKTTGKWERNQSSNELTFAPPRNYTGARAVYRLTVSAKEIPETAYSVDIAVRSEPDPLPAALEAWNAVRTAGVLTLLDAEGEAEEEANILFGETYQQLLKSGGMLEIVPHSSSVVGRFKAAIKDLDPVTGATGTAELGVTHGYTEDRLASLRREAYMLLDDSDSTRDVRNAAQAVLDAIEQVSDTGGSFDGSGSGISFTAPHNYSGSALYFRISVVNAETEELIFNVDVSVRAEENPLSVAVSQLEKAKSDALIAKQTEAIQEAIENAGGDTYIIAGGGSSDDGGSEGDGGGSGGEAGGE